MATQTDISIQEWVATNLAQGTEPDLIAQTLLDQKFPPHTIFEAIPNYVPRRVDIIQRIVTAFNNFASIPHTIQKALLRSDLLDHVALANNVISLRIPELQMPNAERLECLTTQARLLDAFLEEEESQALFAEVLNHFTQTSAINQTQGRYAIPCNTPALEAIDQRVNHYLGIVNGAAYPLEALALNNQYSSSNGDKHAAVMSPPPNAPNADPIWYFFIFLCEGDASHAMSILPLSGAMTLQSGNVVIWQQPANHINDPLRLVKLLDEQTEEALFFLLKRFYQPSSNRLAANERLLHKFIPTYTHTGFRRAFIPEALHAELLRFYQENMKFKQDEVGVGMEEFIQGTKKNHASSVVHLNGAIKTRIHAQLLPIFEYWSGQKLTPTAIYGVRTYHDGAKLNMHVDRYQTHIVSAIVNVYQEVDEDWPLMIYDHMGRRHEVIMKPREMIFYESATIVHGRPIPLNGKSYANVFIHSMPIDWPQQRWPLTRLLHEGKISQQRIWDI